MSGFLSKSKQRLEHTSKLSVGEFKTLQSLLGQEKNLLNSHVRVANDLRKSAHALDEWAQTEGPDLADTLGKVAKLLANDLAKAEEEYADHLGNFRMYFKQLRTREEQFSQLKKNKDTLQGKIDSAEKKLAKMSPEHKDLATWTQKLSDLRNEMVGMENAVINEEAAIGDYRRQTARSAVSHQLAALCQLGEKMTIIGELGKLLTYEIRLDKTEPGRDRGMYNSYDRTLQIYGEAQTCLHKVVFDANNSEPAYTSLPVPSHGDFDQSYEYEQEAQRQSHEVHRQGKGSGRRSSSREPSLPGTAGQHQTTYPTAEQNSSFVPGQSEADRSREPAGFQPLAAPTHVGLENEFSDAVTATWRQQEENSTGYQPYSQTQAVAMHPAQSIPKVNPTPQPTVAYQEEESHGDPYGGAEYSREDDSFNEPEYVEESQMPQRTDEASHQREGISTIEEETQSALQSTEVSAGRGVGGFTNPSATSSDRVQRHQLHDRPVPQDPEIAHVNEASSTGNAQEHAEPGRRTESFDPSPVEHVTERSTGQDFEPSGDDLYGTGLYGVPADPPEVHKVQAPEPTELPREETGATNQEHTKVLPSPPAEAEPAPSYTATPTIQYAPPPPSHDTASHTSPPVSQPNTPAISHQVSPRQTQSPDLAAASALAATAAASIRPRQATQSSAKSVPKQQTHNATATSPHIYTTVATSNSKSPNSPVTPSSPTRRERTPPVKQQSYRSEHRTRQDSNEAMGRSSIAYLNDTPTLEPPMRAPPPVNLGMPLPSTSPYFNPYANLRSTSGGPGDHAASTNGGASGTSGRPKGARTSTLDTTLGSKHGFDMRSVQQAHERPLLQQPSPNLNLGAVREKDYSYAIRTGDDGGGRRLAAGAFRRANPSTSSIPSFRSGNDDATSPAQRLRDEWRSSQSVFPSPASEFVTPAQTPGGLPLEAPASGYIDVGDDMYGERADSRAPLSHRTSAIDAPMDVMPNDDQSHSDLHHIAEGNEETVMPLNVRKKSPGSPSAEFPRPTTADQSSGNDGFNGGQFVTK